MNPISMSNLSVRRASEAAIGIAALRHFAATAEGAPSLGAMAPEILGAQTAGRSIRAAIQTLAQREHEWLKERATHATISTRVNERRDREITSMTRVHAAALTTVQLGTALRSAEPEGVTELQESYVTAIRGIDEFPMGAHAKQALKAQLQTEVELAVPEAARERVGQMLVQAETTYLKRYAEAVYAHYDQPDSSPTM